MTAFWGNWELVANVSTLYSDLPRDERPLAAHEDGFRPIESWWPFDKAVAPRAEIETFIEAVTRAKVSPWSLNAYGGNMEKGERGVLTDPARHNEHDTMSYLEASMCW